MISKISTTKDNIKGLNDHYNQTPIDINTLVFTTAAKFFERLQHYSWEYMGSSLLIGKEDLDLFLVDKSLQVHWYAIAGEDWLPVAIGFTEGVRRFFTLGDWESFEKKFVNQFQGDNS